jgi:citrate lyase subunit beta / citryl-CoA lyase
LHPAVVALQLGAEDLSTELGLERRGDGLELLLARSSRVAASAAAGLRSPIDAVHPDLGDEDGLAAETELARTLGLGGKACIHPRQLATVNRLLAAAEDELGRARRIVAAFDAAGDAGAISVDGQMVDRAIVERARGTLERAGARQRDDDG